MAKKRRYQAAALVLAAILIGAAAMHGPGGGSRYEASFFGCFDTVTVITGYAKSKEDFSGKVGLLEKELRRYHRLFDIYHTYPGISNIKTINDAAGKEPVKVSRDIMDLLSLGKEMCEMTGGQVNIAYGSVLQTWHEYREAGLENPGDAKLPPEDLLRERARHADIGNLVLDEEASTAYLADAQMSLDVGSIGKGFAVQRLSEYAKEIGMDHVLISVGGNVCAVGGRPDGQPWKVGVEDPKQEDGYAAAVSLADATIVTSGDYQRFYEVGGKRYCHIIDPDTRMPASFFPSVSVMAGDSGVADALSTALFNMEVEEGITLVETMPGVEAMWILNDGRIRCTGGFGEYEEM